MTARVGPGSVSELAGLLDELGARSVFVVAGGRSYDASGARGAIERATAERQVTLHPDVSPNPTAEDIEAGVAAFRAAACDVIVAIGGGSVLDTAKLINMCAASAPSATELITRRAAFESAGVPLIAIPTTAGTGAEATHFATVYVGGAKHSAVDPRMLPTHTILDPELLRSLPASTAAATGVDALAQAIESYWAVGATDASRDVALRAVRLAAPTIAAAVNAPTDDARDAMLRASNLAGQAIDISRTTAPHALSYAFTINHGIPHGHAVGLTLGVVFEHNAGVTAGDAVDSRGAEFSRARVGELAEALGFSQPAADMAALMNRIGLTTRLRDLGIARSDLPALVQSVNAERLSNNPRRLDADAVGRMLESLY